jgi:hypothetical protein
MHRVSKIARYRHNEMTAFKISKIIHQSEQPALRPIIKTKSSRRLSTNFNYYRVTLDLPALPQ